MATFGSVRIFRDLMRQTIQHEPRTSDDAWGQPTYGERREYRARIVGRTKLVRNFEGREIVSSMTVYLMTDVAFGPQDLLTLSTGDVGSTESYAIHPAIAATGRYPDEHGQCHTVVYLVAAGLGV